MPDELHDIPDPTPHLPGIALPWYVWAILGLVLTAALATVLVMLLRRKPAATPPDIANTYEESRKQLEALIDEADRHPLSHLATEASFAVRRYLAACLAEPALYETHEEFLLREDALKKLPAGARDHLNPLLEELSTLKYGPSKTDPDIANALITKSLSTLQGLESTRNKI